MPKNLPNPTKDQPSLALVDLFAARELHSAAIEGYAVKHPGSGKVVSNRSFENGYCERPLTLPLSEAQALAGMLNHKTGKPWVLRLAPHPCPRCQRDIWADDRDFCHPNNRERTEWRAGCNEHDFGCGHEVLGTSFEDVMTKWNAGASA
jgi:hypothetical protein